MSSVENFEACAACTNAPFCNALIRTGALYIRTLVRLAGVGNDFEMDKTAQDVEEGYDRIIVELGQMGCLYETSTIKEMVQFRLDEKLE
jgi:hypothetical protein